MNWFIPRVCVLVLAVTTSTQAMVVHPSVSQSFPSASLSECAAHYALVIDSDRGATAPYCRNNPIDNTDPLGLWSDNPEIAAYQKRLARELVGWKGDIAPPTLAGYNFAQFGLGQLQAYTFAINDYVQYLDRLDRLTDELVGVIGGIGSEYAKYGDDPLMQRAAGDLMKEIYTAKANGNTGYPDIALGRLLPMLDAFDKAQVANLMTLGAGELRQDIVGIVPGFNVAKALSYLAIGRKKEATSIVAVDAATLTLGALFGMVKQVAKRVLPELRISAKEYPELAENILNAQRAGHPDVLTHGGNAAANRGAALGEVPNIPPWSRDEYPFASAQEGGGGSWVGHVPVSQQNAQGALLKNFLKKYNIKPGDQYRVVVEP